MKLHKDWIIIAICLPAILFAIESNAYDNHRIVDNYDGSQRIIVDTPSINQGFTCGGSRC